MSAQPLRASEMAAHSRNSTRSMLFGGARSSRPRTSAEPAASRPCNSSGERLRLPCRLGGAATHARPARKQRVQLPSAGFSHRTFCVLQRRQEAFRSIFWSMLVLPQEGPTSVGTG
eukprot:7137930-Prymnesium_polylepis.2